MIKQVKKEAGEVYRNIKTLVVLKIQEILVGIKVYNYSRLLLYKYNLYVTSLKTLKNLVDKGA